MSETTAEVFPNDVPQAEGEESVFVDYISSIFSQEGGDNTLSFKTIAVVLCEGCQHPLANPVILLVNSDEKRDSSVVCSNCTD